MGSLINNVPDDIASRAVSRMVEVLDLERNNRWETDGGYNYAVNLLMEDIKTIVGIVDDGGDAPVGIVALFSFLQVRAEEVLSIRSQFAAQALANRGWTRHGDETLWTPDRTVFNYRTAPIEVLKLIADGWTYRDNLDAKANPEQYGLTN